jgi:trafficking protein particle complex subunit 5
MSRSHKTKSIYDKSPSAKSKSEVSLSLFSLLFSEMIEYISSLESDKDLDEKLQELGSPIGKRILEYTAFHHKHKRDLKIVNMLQFIHNNVWKTLFAKNAEALEKSVDDPTEYRIYDYAPITNRFLSTKHEALNASGFVAGIIAGVLNSAGFYANVASFLLEEEGVTQASNSKVIYVIKFTKAVVEREL